MHYIRKQPVCNNIVNILSALFTRFMNFMLDFRKLTRNVSRLIKILTKEDQGKNYVKVSLPTEKPKLFVILCLYVKLT